MEAVTVTEVHGRSHGLARVPLLRDYWNLRAAAPPDAGSVADALKVALPTVLATALTVAEQVTKVLTFIPNAARVAQALLPGACAIICGYIIAKIAPSQKPDAAAGFATHRQDPQPVYAFPSAMRTTAKVLLPLLSAAAIVSLNEIAPNVGPRNLLGGYLCRLHDGAPVAAGEVDVFNVSGQSAVVAPDIVGDDGFFAIQLRTWAGRPRVLRIRARGCEPEEIDVTRSHGESTCCPGSTPDPARRGEYPVWNVPCRSSAP